jgi:hypothetical protein
MIMNHRSWKVLLSDWTVRLIAKALLVMLLAITVTCLVLYDQIISANVLYAFFPEWLSFLPGWAWKVLPHSGWLVIALAWLCWFKGDRAVNGARRAARRTELGLR